MSPLLALRYRLEYFILRLVVGFFRLFPLEMAAEFLARSLKKLAPGGRRHKKALANLEIAFPEKSHEEREAIALQMWDNIGRVIVETMQIDRLLEDPYRLQLDNDFFVKRYKGKMGTVVIAGMHMGNWEIGCWPLAMCESNVAAVYRLVKNPYVDEYLRSMRGQLYPGGLFAKGRARGKSAGLDTARMIGSYVRHGMKNETASIAFLADLYDGKGISGSSVWQGGEIDAVSGHAGPSAGRAHVGRTLHPDRRTVALSHFSQGNQGSAHRRCGEGCAPDYRCSAKAV